MTHLFQEFSFPFLPDPSLLPILFPSFSSVILRAAKNLSIVPDFHCNSIDGCLQYGLLQLALPNDDDTPALSLQLTPDLLIPFLISGNLSYPELCVGFRNRIILTVFVAVPKAAVYEDCSPVF